MQNFNNQNQNQGQFNNNFNGANNMQQATNPMQMPLPQQVIGGQNQPPMPAAQAQAQAQNQGGGMPISAQSALAALPQDMLAMLAAGAGEGMEEADRDSYSIPYLLMVQAQSPITLENPNARAGMFFNTTNNTLMQEVTFIPCHFQRRYIKWLDGARDGASYAGTYSIADVENTYTKDENNQYFCVENGQKYVFTDTRLHYVLYFNTQNQSWEPALISLNKTQIKNSKKLMAMFNFMTMRVKNKVVTMPSYACIYNAKSVLEKNDKGQWFGWSFSQVRPLAQNEAELLQQAKALHDSIIAGEINVAEPIDNIDNDVQTVQTQQAQAYQTHMQNLQREQMQQQQNPYASSDINQYNGYADDCF